MRRNRKRHRRNGWSNDDKILAAVGVVTAIGIFAIVKQKKDAANVAAATAGLRGLGAYFVDPVNIPISGLGLNGLGANYVAVR